MLGIVRLLAGVLILAAAAYTWYCTVHMMKCIRSDRLHEVPDAYGPRYLLAHPEVLNDLGLQYRQRIFLCGVPFAAGAAGLVLLGMP